MIFDLNSLSVLDTLSVGLDLSSLDEQAWRFILKLKAEGWRLIKAKIFGIRRLVGCRFEQRPLDVKGFQRQQL